MLGEIGDVEPQHSPSLFRLDIRSIYKLPQQFEPPFFGDPACCTVTEESVLLRREQGSSCEVVCCWDEAVRPPHPEQFSDAVLL